MSEDIAGRPVRGRSQTSPVFFIRRVLRVTVDIEHPEKAAAALTDRILPARTTAAFRSAALGNMALL